MTSEQLCKLLREALGGRSEAAVAPSPSPPDQAWARIALPPAGALIIIAQSDFPSSPPLIRFEPTGGGDVRYFGIDWSEGRSAVEQMGEGLGRLIAGPGPFRAAWADDARYPLTDDAAEAGRAGWRRVFATNPAPEGLKTSAGLRVGPGTAALLGDATVAIFGLGSVGSYLAEQLVRSGLSRVVGMDFDEVESHNLTRTTFDMADVGRSKAEALSRRLVAIRPDVQLDLRVGDLVRAPVRALRDLFESADIIIAATDQPEAQSRINMLAQSADRTAVFVSLYRGAKGGEVVFSVPGVTPCYECATGARRAMTDRESLEAARDPANYGRLAGELALVADIHHVASAALKLIVSLISASRDPAQPGSALAVGAMSRGHGMVMLAMEPEYSLFPQAMGNAAGQYAFSSIWLNGSSHPDCAVCGDARDPHFDAFGQDIFVMSDRERERLRSAGQD
jgi:hypothetical protein